MALIRWEPVPVNRLLNNLFDTPTAGFGSVSRSWIPAIDIVETDDDYVLRADLPGLTEQDVNVELHNDVLTVSGERKSEHEERKQGYYRVERSSGSFRRSVRLPEGVAPESIRATFERGVLEVTVPKPAQQGPHKVAITAGEGDSAPVAEVEAPAADDAKAAA
jgi:HSP20 family protein